MAYRVPEEQRGDPGKLRGVGFRVVWDEQAPQSEERERMSARLRKRARSPLPPGVASVVPMLSRPVEFASVPTSEFLREPQYELDAAGQEVAPWRVRLDPYEMSRHEITVGQYLEFCKSTHRTRPKLRPGHDRRDLPITDVTWWDAVGFCRWLTVRMNSLGSPGIIRLPWEMEWEFAARGGETGLDGQPVRTTVLGTTAPSDVPKRGWYHSSVPTEVGMFPPNALGIYDLGGNVQEWCGDRALPLRPPPNGLAVNPKGTNAPTETWRIIRGDSSWRDYVPAKLKRRQSGLSTDYALWDTGFRVVRQLSSDASAQLLRRRPDGSAARREALRIIEHMPVWWTIIKKREPKVTAQILDSLKKLDEFHLVTLRWAMDRHQEPARGDAYVDHAFSASCRLRVVNRYVFNVDLRRDLDRAWPLGFDSSGEITLIDEPSQGPYPSNYPDAVAEFDHFKRKFGRRKRRPSGIPPSTDLMWPARSTRRKRSITAGAARSRGHEKICSEACGPGDP